MFVLRKISDRIKGLKIPQRKNKKSVYLRLLYSYILITVFTVLLITSALYSIFSYNSVQEISNISVKMMSQTRYSADFIWNWASAYGYSLYYDNAISQSLYTNDLDKILDANVDRKLTAAVTSNPLIDSIYVYNGYSKRFISSVTSVLDENDFYDQEIVTSGLQNQRGYYLFLRVSSYLHLHSETKIVKTRIDNTIFLNYLFRK